jgi:radical SAM protein (TIGR01212 family)
LLLDICCGPCAAGCIPRLLRDGYDVAGFFCNDNIDTSEEFTLRLEAARAVCVHLGIGLIEIPYDHQSWLSYVQGYEQEPERGIRCAYCFEYRFRKAFSYLREHGYDVMTSTLPISPHKNAAVIEEIGMTIAGPQWLTYDFRSDNGYEEAKRTAKSLGLYRQKYCGCEFARLQQEERMAQAQARKAALNSPEDPDDPHDRSQAAFERRRKGRFLYRSFNEWLREHYGTIVYRLSLSAGFSCPNLDGTISDKGCVFCDNRSFSTFAWKEQVYDLRTQVSRLRTSLAQRFGAQKFIAYFQSNTNTYADLARLKETYDVIREYPDVVGLSVSTRPDCLDDERLDLLCSYQDRYDVYVELGLQSMHERSLAWMNRGHSREAFDASVRRAAARGIRVGAHVILGLPGESFEDMMATAEHLASLPLWGVKLHVLHAIKSTPLADMYHAGTLSVLSQSEYAHLAVEFMRRLPKEFVILRLVSDCDRNYLIAPEWVSDKQAALREIEWLMIDRGYAQGDLFHGR